MRRIPIALTLAASTLTAGALCSGAHAQTGYDPAPFVPRADVALGYDYLRSNAPPNGQPKFSANGGFASVNVHLLYFLGVAGEVSGTHANDISNLGQNLTLITYQAGPRIMAHYRRFTFFGEGLVGAAHGSDSYFPTTTSFTTSASSFAYSAGGGVDYAFSRRWAVRAQAEYLHTALPNGVDNEQQHLSVGMGVVYRFGIHVSHPKGLSAKPAPEPVSTPAPAPEPVIAAPPVEPPQATVAPVIPSAPSYEPLVTAPAPPQLSESGTDTDFHTHVKDVLFDYESYGLNLDALSTIVQAAVYLKLHPEVTVLIGGFSDERGTVEYNLSLGQKRASAVKEALLAAGIEPKRVMIVSYGKGAQVCDKEDEACWKRNRRAAFMKQPEPLQ